MSSSPINSIPSSPTSFHSPTYPSRRKAASDNGVPPGFLASPRRRPPVAKMSVRDLLDLQQANIKLLANPGASTSSYAQRIFIEQAAIEARLVELQGVEDINTSLKHTHIQGDDDMVVDTPSESVTSPMIDAKRKALARWRSSETPSHIGTMNMDEAMSLEREAWVRDQERKQRIEEKEHRRAQQIQSTVLTPKEREARILAFMNYKPSDSDLEDDANEDSDDDPASWFEDDQDDGRKGQDIVYPDEEDYSNIIRIDENRLRYNTFYEPRDSDE